MTAHWPTSQESFDIEERARELAVQGFDEVDTSAREWLHDNGTDCMLALRSAITHKFADLMHAIEKMRDRYVAECAHLYRAQAEQERDEYEQAKAESLHDDRGENR